ncbi:MAG TPA: NAD(P)/FAD-dependent oxidoreductase [Methylomirabilota bacterium]|nr:NAD(P)/FAD-dependent oxidoreductase [Methylomirabilota bacterium]
MAQHDVIVVGGGPGGSTAAWRLARAGLRPLLLDTAVFPRVKVCAGWVTSEALADAQVDPQKYPLTIQAFSACRFEFDGARTETRWRRPASYGILRREFDHYLLDRARAAGVDVREGARVTAVTEEADGIRVASPHGTFTAPVAIGAGGHRCPVAHALGEVSEREEVVVAQESETRLSPQWIEALARWWDAPELYVEPDLKGYGWYFPKGDVLNVGVGCVSGPGADLPGRRDALVSALRAAGRLPADLPIEPFRGHAYVVRRRAPRKLAGDRFCLIGDAAGLARDLSGEGIGPAIKSGILAAEAVEARLRRGAPLEAYAAAIVRRYGSGETGWLGRQLARIPDSWARAVVRTILNTAATRRHVVFGRIFGMREVAS